MEVKFKCLPPNCKVWMDDDKIIMRYTLNVTSQVWDRLENRFPGHTVRSSKRFMFGSAVYMKAMDKKTVMAAYRYLKHLSMARIRTVKTEILNEEIASHCTCSQEQLLLWKYTGNSISQDVKIREKKKQKS